MSKIRFFLIYIFLYAILLTNSISASDYVENALRLYSERNYYAASLEFERAAYYGTDNTRIAHYKYLKSLCFKNLNDHKRAIEELNKINVFNLPDTLFYKIRYAQAYSYFLNNEPNKSLWNIEEIRIRFPDSLKITEIVPLNILCLNAIGKWSEAKYLWQFFLKNAGLEDSVKIVFLEEIEALYSKRNIPKIYSAKTAETLSRFIPGAGQMYCGEFMEGSFNFIMNAAILAFAGYEFYMKYYITGYFVGLGLLNKTYNGGWHRAELLAEEKNFEEIRKFNLKTSTLLMRVLSEGKKDHGPWTMDHIL